MEKEYSYELKIPKERVAVLIGKGGETKSLLEEETSTSIDVDSKEGEVIISSSEGFKLAENIVLKPGEQAAFDENTREIAIKRVDTNLYTSWRNNKLVFYWF